MRPDEIKTSGMRDEANVYADVYRLLIGGMILSNVLFAAGMILALLRPKFVPLTSQWIRAQYHWSTLIRGLASGEPVPLLLLATLLLILTPLARVIVSIAAFASDRDYKYVVVTSAVMLVLLATIGLGFLGLQ